ncbi:ASCH domain-containing protein [bacterium]|nr:ASCH domain-containing protein [bacterium]
MCTILLSIKPEYSNKILDGTKKYEFRRQIAKRKVDRILIYSTSPEMKVVAEVEVVGVLKDSPKNLWQKTQKSAGISFSKFMDYFEKCQVAYAYSLGELQAFDKPKLLSDYGISTAPQSFVYIA